MDLKKKHKIDVIWNLVFIHIPIGLKIYVFL